MRARLGALVHSRPAELVVIALVALDVAVATAALFAQSGALQIPGSTLLLVLAPIVHRVLLGLFIAELGALFVAFGSEVMLTVSYTTDFAVVAVCGYVQYRADVGEGSVTRASAPPCGSPRRARNAVRLRLRQPLACAPPRRV